MTPPNRMFPYAMPLVDDFTVANDGAKPSLMHFNARSSYERWIAVEPGVLVNHEPLLFVSVQLAPITSVLPITDLTDTTCMLPSKMLAQPDRQVAIRGRTHRNFARRMRCPVDVVDRAIIVMPFVLRAQITLSVCLRG